MPSILFKNLKFLVLSNDEKFPFWQFSNGTPCINTTLHIQSMFYVKMVVVWTSFTRSFTTPFAAILMMNFNFRNVVTGAHYHFVSRWTSSSAYIAASLVMMVFVSKLDSFSVYVQCSKYKQSTFKICENDFILGILLGMMFQLVKSFRTKISDLMQNYTF